MKYTKPLDGTRWNVELNDTWFGRYIVTDFLPSADMVEMASLEEGNKSLIALAPAMFEKLCELGGLYADVEYWFDEVFPAWREVGEE